MVEPVIAHRVTRGIHDDYEVLAVFTDRAGAQEFADHHNLSTDRYSRDDRAQLEEVALYGAGWRRPPTEVLDGEVITVPGQPRSASARPQHTVRTAPAPIAQAPGGGR